MPFNRCETTEPAERMTSQWRFARHAAGLHYLFGKVWTTEAVPSNWAGLFFSIKNRIKRGALNQKTLKDVTSNF